MYPSTFLHQLATMQVTRPAAGRQQRSQAGQQQICHAAVPLRAPPADDQPAERARIAEQTGYRTIGAELPDDVSLGDIVASLPKDVRLQPCAVSK